MTEQHIQLAAKLYRCRSTAKNFFKEEFFEKIKPYQVIIEKVMEQNKLDECAAAFRICQEPNVIANGMATMMFCATAVEMVEPSK